MRRESPAQAPEKLFRERAFLAFTGLLVLAVIALFFVDIPWLGLLLERVVYELP